jgi:hypothetical protein
MRLILIVTVSRQNGPQLLHLGIYSDQTTARQTIQGESAPTDEDQAAVEVVRNADLF